MKKKTDRLSNGQGRREREREKDYRNGERDRQIFKHIEETKNKERNLERQNRTDKKQ